MSSRNSDLKKAIRHLNNANPQAFKDFLSLFDDYTGEVLKALSEAPTDEVLKCQGRAQQCRALMRLFVEARDDPQPTP